MTIKVLIVDDSALIRQLLTEIFSVDSRLIVVGTASDPIEARDKIKLYNPDVITLDIEMPKMNGITFLKNLMRLRPMPVVMISTLTQTGAPATLEALELGAVDFIGKPNGADGGGLASYRDKLISKVVAAAKANVGAREQRSQSTAVMPATLPSGKLKHNFLCAIGASTGGTEAIKEVLMQMPEESPPIVITQHIPAAFSGTYAQRLNNHSTLTVYEAKDGQPIKAGCAYLAPGGRHLHIDKGSYGYVCRLTDGDLVNRHKPAVDVLYESVIAAAGNKAMGVLLTGMGADGARQLLAMRKAGCMTIAQDEATSVVWGMPGTAVKLDAAERILPLNQVARAILQQAYADS